MIEIVLSRVAKVFVVEIFYGSQPSFVYKIAMSSFEIERRKTKTNFESSSCL